MDQTTVEALYRKFAAPFAGYVSSTPERKESAAMLTRILWTATIAGPEMEEEIWLILKTTGKLDDDSLQIIKQAYFEQMKPVLSEEDRAHLRKRYEMVRKT